MATRCCGSVSVSVSLGTDEERDEMRSAVTGESFSSPWRSTVMVKFKLNLLLTLFETPTL